MAKFDPDIVRDGEHEHRRLKRKIKDYIKKNLRDYITQGHMVGRKGKKLIKLPITGIRLPNFERDRKKTGGVGQGPGDEGDPLPGQGQPRPGPGDGKAGDKPGDHAVEMEIDVKELLEILSEALELPNIEEKGKKKIVSTEIEYTDLRKHGPESLLDIKRTLRNTLLRTLCGLPDAPKSCPDLNIDPDDRVYKTWEEKTEECVNAVVFAIMDVSGSMGREQKQVVATTMFWIEEWLKQQYKGSVEIVHIVHDTRAWEVSYSEFYTIQEGGGTKISPALKLCDEIIDARYPADDWNIYPFFFSDGDNWGEDNSDTINVLQNVLIDKVNQICYGQVQGTWGTGDLYKLLLEKLGGCEKLCVYEIKKHEDILGAIKKFLGRGR